MLLNESLPLESAGRGAFLIAGYCACMLVKTRLFVQYGHQLTEVLRTPYLVLSGLGGGAGGVSIKSNDSSEYVERSLRSDDILAGMNWDVAVQLLAKGQEQRIIT